MFNRSSIELIPLNFIAFDNYALSQKSICCKLICRLTQLIIAMNFEMVNPGSSSHFYAPAAPFYCSG